MSDPTPNGIPPSDDTRAPFAAWWTLAVLLVLALNMTAHRPMIDLLVEPPRKVLSLSHHQAEPVQGDSVALFTAVVSWSPLPGRVKAECKLAAVNRSSKAGQQGDFLS